METFLERIDQASSAQEATKMLLMRAIEAWKLIQQDQVACQEVLGTETIILDDLGQKSYFVILFVTIGNQQLQNNSVYQALQQEEKKEKLLPLVQQLHTISQQ
jgi:hypothetical protein